MNAKLIEWKYIVARKSLGTPNQIEQFSESLRE